MSADALTTLREHDPARTLAPLDDVQREQLRCSIVERRPLALPLQGVRRRPLGVVAAAAAAALVFATAAWGVYRLAFDSPAQVRDDFAAWTHRIELPPGASWTQPRLDEDGVYGGRAAQMMAVGQATCAWLADWDSAFRVGDGARMKEATAGLAAVRALMPVHADGANEETGGYDAASLGVVDRILAQQERGRPQLTEQFLWANCA